MQVVRFVKIGLTWAASLLITLPVVLVGVLVYAFSASVRGLARILEPKFVDWKELIEFDPELGWKPIANLDAHYLVPRDGIYRILTDSEGWPRKDTLNRDHDVVAIGDSYAYGFGIDTGSSFADLTETPRVKALGAPGYSMVQGLILMRQRARQLSGKLVVWFVYVENDLYDNLFPSVFGYRAPFARNKNGSETWEIVSEHVTSDTWVSSARIRPNLDILAELCTPNPLSDRVFSACNYLIDEANAVCRDAGAQLVVFAIPNMNQLEPAGRKRLARKASSDDFDVMYPEKRLAEICGELDVPFVAGSEHLESSDYKIWERWHWNEGGHSKVAELLRTLHESHTAGHLETRSAPSSAKSVSAHTLLTPTS